MSPPTGALYLPDSTDAALSPRALEGMTTSRLPVTFFGPHDPHILDGRLGRGGTPIILSSASGLEEMAEELLLYLVAFGLLYINGKYHFSLLLLSATKIDTYSRSYFLGSSTPS
ncbi:MAG: hypothetical protein ACJ74W_23345 [Pyrinomonadaceae bacterium]